MKLNFSKEWYERMAEKFPNGEGCIEAGNPAIIHALFNKMKRKKRILDANKHDSNN